MRKHALASAALAAAFLIPSATSAAFADDKTHKPDPTQQTQTTDADLPIMAHYHHLNQMEIEMGRVATKNGGAAAKKYGQLMIKDHGKADKDLLGIAKAKQVTIPAPAPKDDAEAKEMQEQMALMERLRNLKGTEFDKEYLTAMQSGHEKELAKVDSMITASSDKRVKAYVQKVKGSLKKHADAAKKAQAPQKQARR